MEVTEAISVSAVVKLVAALGTNFVTRKVASKESSWELLLWKATAPDVKYNFNNH